MARQPLSTTTSSISGLSVFSHFVFANRPMALGFVLSAYRHIFLFRPIALSSPSWELLPSWPFSGHASLSTASEYGLTAVCPSSLPSHRVSDYFAAYRLLKLRPLTLNLIPSITHTSLHGHLPRIWHSSTKLTTCSCVRSRTLQPIALPAHDYVFASERLLPQQALPSLSILFDLTPFSRPIARLSQCILALMTNFISRHTLPCLPLLWTQLNST